MPNDAMTMRPTKGPPNSSGYLRNSEFIRFEGAFGLYGLEEKTAMAWRERKGSVRRSHVDDVGNLDSDISDGTFVMNAPYAMTR